GTIRDVVFRHDLDNPVAFSVSWTEDEPFVIQDPLAQARKVKSILHESQELSIETELRASRSGFDVVETSYGVGDTKFTMTRRDVKRVEYELNSNAFEFLRNPGRPWNLPHPARFYGFPDQVRLYYQNASFLADLELRFEERLSHIRYLGPLRDDPRRQYIYSGGTPRDVGRRGEFAVEALIASEIADTRVTRG